METPASTSRWSNEPLSSPPNCLQPWQVTTLRGRPRPVSRGPLSRPQPRTRNTNLTQLLLFLSPSWLTAAAAAHTKQSVDGQQGVLKPIIAPLAVSEHAFVQGLVSPAGLLLFFLPGRLQCRSPLGRPVRVFPCLPDARVVCRCDWPHCVTALPAPQAAQEVERHNSGLIRHSLVLLSV